MKGGEKQKAGFKFGIHKTYKIKDFGSFIYKDTAYNFLNLYNLSLIKADGKIYYALRLYHIRENKKKFIKQFLFEPEIVEKIIHLLEQGRNDGKEKKDRVKENNTDGDSF